MNTLTGCETDVLRLKKMQIRWKDNEFMFYVVLKCNGNSSICIKIEFFYAIYLVCISG